MRGLGAVLGGGSNRVLDQGSKRNEVGLDKDLAVFFVIGDEPIDGDPEIIGDLLNAAGGWISFRF